jgi:hypothetical protein
LPGDAPSASPQAAKVSLALAILAFAGGAICILGQQWPPGIILLLAGVAGTLTSVQIRGRLSQPSTMPPDRALPGEQETH